MIRKVSRTIPLKEFLTLELNISGTQAKRLIDNRSIFVNQQRVWIATYTLKKGDTVEVQEKKTIAPTQIPILYEDTQFLIINKPAGLLTNGQGSAEERLKTQLKKPQILAVHRLDKDTTGVNLFAYGPENFELAKELFTAQKVQKVYRALVSGFVAKSPQTISKPLDGQTAVSHLKVLSANPTASYIEVEIDTGRTHQIRLHAAGIGHPVVGEKHYQTTQIKDQTLRAIPRQMLHAYQIGFLQPTTGKNILVTAPEPADFLAAKKSLKL